jgi:hypothetical protein
LARQAPEKVGRDETHWSRRSLAQAAEDYVGHIAHTTVDAILQEADLHPEQMRYWKTVIWDEEAVARATKILWYYERIESLWQRGEVIICVDEKPNIQVLERAKPTQPMRPGQPERQEFEYLRHGTVNLLVGLITYNGRMWGECLDRNDGAHFRPAIRRLLHPYGSLIQDPVIPAATPWPSLRSWLHASKSCGRQSTARGSIRPSRCWKPSVSGICCAAVGAAAS